MVQVNGATNLTWTFDEKLAAIGGSVSFSYDGDGNRIGKASGLGTFEYLVDPTTPYAQVLEEVKNGNVRTRFDFGLDIVRMERTSGVYYSLCDALGSARALSDSTGALSESYGYVDAFGQPSAGGQGTLGQPFFLNGQQWDSDAGLYYLRARYYDAETGRFLSRDPYSGDTTNPVTQHPYLYASIDPLNNVDPSGNVTIGQVLIGSSIVGGIVGGITGGISGGAKGAAYGAAAGILLSPIITAAVIYGGIGIAPIVGVSPGTGIAITGGVANTIFAAAGIHGITTAQTDRQRLAATVSLVFTLAGGYLGAKTYFGVRSGRGTFTNADPMISPEEVALGKWMADVLRADIVKRPPVGPHGPGTADYHIAFQGKTLELKNLQNSNLSGVVSQILHSQGDNVAVVLRPGQFTEAQINSIQGRVFSPRAPGRPKNTIRIIFDTGNGYLLGPEFNRVVEYHHDVIFP